MVYGPTFNANHIPRDLLNSFPKLRKVDKGMFAALRGVCNTRYELEGMIKKAQAEGMRFWIESNGHQGWTGFYCAKRELV